MLSLFTVYSDCQGPQFSKILLIIIPDQLHTSLPFYYFKLLKFHQNIQPFLPYKNVRVWMLADYVHKFDCDECLAVIFQLPCVIKKVMFNLIMMSAVYGQTHNVLQTFSLDVIELKKKN